MTSDKLAEILKVSESTIWKYSYRLGISKTKTGQTWCYIYSNSDAFAIANCIDRLHCNSEKCELLNNYLNSLDDEVKPTKIYKTMYKLHEFPAISSYTFLTECNTVPVKVDDDEI